jgi:hypothetical protein
MAESDVRKALTKHVAEGRLIDFSQLGNLIAEHGPALFAEVSRLGGGEVATDYVVWGYESVVHAWHNLEATKGQILEPEVLAAALKEAGIGR